MGVFTGNKREPNHDCFRGKLSRTGRFWIGPINPAENATRMRREYIAATAKLVSIHGWHCYERFNLDIKA